MRSIYCGELNESNLDQEVTLCGWVHRRRDHGGVIFVDLRDHTGLLQVVFDPDTEETFATAESVRNEFVLQVEGRVRRRPEGTVNPDMPTGQVEVLGKTLSVLNAAETPPFQLDDQDVQEETRLRYRYIDLRRPEMQEKIRLRARITHSMRSFLDSHGFIDVETPILTRSTPEGARDYLVPSRTHTGEFFALPQSPQLFKQLFMVAGLDRYFQVVKCFRDEDLRADRQPWPQRPHAWSQQRSVATSVTLADDLLLRPGVRPPGRRRRFGRIPGHVQRPLCVVPFELWSVSRESS